MNFPISKIRVFFYRLRGSKIEKHVAIAPLVFMEEGYPELITIRENTSIGPLTTIVTHHTIFSHSKQTSTPYNAPVVIGKNCYIGSGVIILPGVTIGDNSIIAAGSVVTKSIPNDSVAMGVPAKVIGSREEWSRNHLVSK